MRSGRWQPCHLRIAIVARNDYERAATREALAEKLKGSDQVLKQRTIDLSSGVF